MMTPRERQARWLARRAEALASGRVHCACGRVAVKVNFNEPVCARCLEIEARLYPSWTEAAQREVCA